MVSGKKMKTPRSYCQEEYKSLAFARSKASIGNLQLKHHRKTMWQSKIIESLMIWLTSHNMFIHKRISNEFCANAIYCVVYLINRSPTKVVWNKTLEEEWSCRKPSVRHLCIFGSTTYAHIPEQSDKSCQTCRTNVFFLAMMKNPKSTDIGMLRDASS